MKMLTTPPTRTTLEEPEQLATEIIDTILSSGEARARYILYCLLSTLLYTVYSTVYCTFYCTVFCLLTLLSTVYSTVYCVARYILRLVPILGTCKVEIVGNEHYSLISTM